MLVDGCDMAGFSWNHESCDEANVLIHLIR